MGLSASSPSDFLCRLDTALQNLKKLMLYKPRTKFSRTWSWTLSLGWESLSKRPLMLPMSMLSSNTFWAESVMVRRRSSSIVQRRFQSVPSMRMGSRLVG